MVYRCPECGKTHIHARLVGYTCRKDWRKERDCPRYFLTDKTKKPLHEYDFYDREGACCTCDFRGEPVFHFLCKDCNKAFSRVEIELNGTDCSNDTSKVQNSFVLKNDDSDPTPEGV